MKLKYSRQIFQKFSTTNLVKIHPVGAEFFHAKGQKDGRIWWS